MELRFPSAPEELTPEWLTDVLHRTGCLNDARVTALSTERIGEGVGFVGQIARVTPAYDLLEAGAPRTIIGKFPSADEAGREIAALYGLYRCEVNFYRLIAGAISLRTPRCFFSAMDDDATEFILLLEDLSSTGRLGDQVAGCTIEEARLAVEQLGVFHASWWQNARLNEMDWLPLGVDLARVSLEEAYPSGWEPALDRYGHLLSPEIREAAPTLNERVLRRFGWFEEAPRTITHADYRLDNMFFGSPGSGYELAVIDWQIANRGLAAYDVAYFLGSNLLPDDRRAQEQSLLRTYHEALVGGGVHDYPRARLQEDYVLSMLLILVNNIGNTMNLDPANERGLQLFELILGRVATAAAELHALDTVA